MQSVQKAILSATFNFSLLKSGAIQENVIWVTSQTPSGQYFTRITLLM
jgi:hypothetical protein